MYAVTIFIHIIKLICIELVGFDLNKLLRGKIGGFSENQSKSGGFDVKKLTTLPLWPDVVVFHQNLRFRFLGSGQNSAVVVVVGKNLVVVEFFFMAYLLK